AEKTKFQASGTIERVSGPVATHNVFEGDGGARPGGPFAMTLWGKTNFGNQDTRGVFVLDFGGGDTLTCDFGVDWMPDLGLYVGPYVITGGTGRLAGARQGAGGPAGEPPDRRVLPPGACRQRPGGPAPQGAPRQTWTGLTGRNAGAGGRASVGNHSPRPASESG